MSRCDLFKKKIKPTSFVWQRPSSQNWDIKYIFTRLFLTPLYQKSRLSLSCCWLFYSKYTLIKSNKRVINHNLSSYFNHCECHCKISSNMLQKDFRFFGDVYLPACHCIRAINHSTVRRPSHVEGKSIILLTNFIAN